MASEQEPFQIAFPLWLVVGRKLWLAADPGCVVLVNTATIGYTPALFTDEHAALEFLDDANEPEWCTILVRDAAELLGHLRAFAAAGVEYVGIDLGFPGAPRTRVGTFPPVRHIIERAGGS